MKRLPLEVGSVAVSTAGRDQGRTYAVIAEIDSDFVLTADGDARKMARPKKKRRSHLKASGKTINALRERILAQKPPQDHELRAWLKEEEG